MKYFYTNIISHVFSYIKEIVFYRMQYDEGQNNMHTIMSLSKETHQGISWESLTELRCKNAVHRKQKLGQTAKAECKCLPWVCRWCQKHQNSNGVETLMTRSRLQSEFVHLQY